jgi:hypothetical protein
LKLFVILAVLALVGFALWQKWRRLPPQTKQLLGAIFGMAGAYRQAKKQGANPSTGQSRKTVASGLMLPCVQCGLHVLEQDGVRASGEFYCCAEHVR